MAGRLVIRRISLRWMLTGAACASLTFGGGLEPLISEDGSLIAFTSYGDLAGDDPAGSPEVFVIRPDGTGLRRVTNSPGGGSDVTSISGDGSLISFHSDGDPSGENPEWNREVFIVNSDGSQVHQITSSTWGMSGNPSISADGAMIAFVSNADLVGQNPDGNYELFLAVLGRNEFLPPGHVWEYTFTDPTGDPAWNTTTGVGGNWLLGHAPFGNMGAFELDPLGHFSHATLWPSDGPDGDDLWLRTSIDLTDIDLPSVQWDLGVDNGFKLYANGLLVAQDNAEGYTFRWEYSRDFDGTLVDGVNVIALALEDHGACTDF